MADCGPAGFKAGYDKEPRNKFRGESMCAAFFYTAVLGQVIWIIAIFASTNSVMPTIEWTTTVDDWGYEYNEPEYKCPNGMKMGFECGENQFVFKCVSEAVCSDMNALCKANMDDSWEYSYSPQEGSCDDTLTENSCLWACDGYCDDSDVCELGTDVTDCSRRLQAGDQEPDQAGDQIRMERAAWTPAMRQRRLQRLENMTLSEKLRDISQQKAFYPPAARKLAARRLEGERVSYSTWEFFGEFVHVPLVILFSLAAASIAFLFFLTKFTRAMVWSLIFADFVVMVAGVIWFYVELEALNYFFIIVALCILIGAFMMKAQIENSIVILRQAMDGLSANKRIFFVCFMVTVVWAFYFVLWIVSLLKMFDIIEVLADPVPGQSTCTVGNPSWVGNAVWFWVLMLFWTYQFQRGAKLTTITIQLSDWYFTPADEQGNRDRSVWRKALGWSVNPAANAGAIGGVSFLIAFSEWLMAYTKPCRMILAMFNPVEWLLVCLALVLKTILYTYTKFALIGHAYSNEPFCSNAGKVLKLLKDRCGEAIICDYIASRVMNWCTYFLALAVTFGVMLWANDLQGAHEANALMGNMGVMIGVTLMYLYFINQPFLSIVLVIVLEMLLDMLDQMMGGSDQGMNGWHPVRAVCTSVLAALFCGSITMLLLTCMSHVVVSTCDVVYFCFAVEQDLGNLQERFQALYEAIKVDISPGVIGAGANGQVVMAQPAVMQVQVPAGAGPGTVLQVQGPTGPFQVSIPAGIAPGGYFSVQVPPPAAAAVAMAPAQPVNVVGTPQPQAAPPVPVAVAAVPVNPAPTEAGVDSQNKSDAPADGKATN